MLEHFYYLLEFIVTMYTCIYIFLRFKKKYSLSRFKFLTKIKYYLTMNIVIGLPLEIL